MLKRLRFQETTLFSITFKIRAFQKIILTRTTLRIHWHYPHPFVAVALNISLKELELGKGICPSSFIFRLIFFSY